MTADTTERPLERIVRCVYCGIHSGEYNGEKFQPSKKIDGARQDFEISIFDSPEDECYVIEILGTHTDVRVDIKFCPMCGRNL